MKRRDFIFKVAAASAFLPLQSYGFDKLSNPKHKKITILHTNDTHSHIESFPKEHAKYPAQGGVARRATFFQQKLKENPNTLILDAGDMFQGTPYFNYYKGEIEIKTMNMLGYQAGTIGNHEFDRGIENLATQIKKAHFDILSANYDFRNTPMEGLTKEYKTMYVDGIKVGIFGLGVVLEGLVNRSDYKETQWIHPIEKAQDMVRILKEDERAQLIICLSHLGYKYDDGSQMISDLELAQKTAGIDLIIGGHTHTFLEKPTPVTNLLGTTTLVNQVGCYGVRVGQIDFYFDEWNHLTSQHNGIHQI